MAIYSSMANSSRTNKSLLNKIFIFVLLVAITKWCTCSSSNSSSFNNVGCKDSERKALLNFKHSLSFFGTHVTSTWEGEDCCKWHRVSCDPTTGHVLKLHFSGRCLDFEDKLSFIKTEDLESSLQHLKELKHLEHLDLSCNNFSRSSMPKALGSMQQRLRYLNLSNTLFSKGIPDELSNLTHLQSLDLSYADSLTFNHLNWVSSLRELEYLDMSGSNLSQADDWVKSLIGPLPSLRELRLAHCELSTYNEAVLNSSLLSLPIQHLDLSYSQLGRDIPSFIQNLTYLEFLDLSSANFGPNVPLWLGKLQSLVHVDLSGNEFSSIDARSIWGLVHNLCSLRFLSLSNNNLQGNVLEPQENSSTICTRYDLEVLYLYHNINISGAIPAWLGEKFQSLEELDLSQNQLSGEIPASLGNLLVLKKLHLYDNQLSQISSFFKFPSTLNWINLSENNLTGEIPKSLGNLSKLQSLDMSSNPLLIGTILSKAHFTKLSNLSSLDLSDAFLTLKCPDDWVPPFQLENLWAANCKINGNFPQWLQTQKQLNTLNLSNASISGAIPKWFHTMQQLEHVDLSYNHISGSPVFPINFWEISLSNNALSGPFFGINSSLHINITYPDATSVDLSSNSISGLLPAYLGRRMPTLDALVLSNNQIYGPIPKSMCQLDLETLDLQNNSLSGTIPDCLGSSERFVYIMLSFNNLWGNVPCSAFNVSYLHLNDNKLSGLLPPCSSTNIKVLDVGGNKLIGKLPAWLNKEKAPYLKILRLRGNKLNDSIPHHLCSLSGLQILDLSQNHLSGTIPSCLNEITAMNSPQSDDYREVNFSKSEEVKEVIQGIERAYTSTLKYLVNIDLSYNELVGNIPAGITNLSCLLNLNLSNNHLSGAIPQKIGAMKSLVALDFSKNRLEGTIPTSMAELYRLEDLNLSYNNLSGQIPTGNQLRTLTDPSFYAGNPFLCGDPLPKKCKTINGAPEGSENKGVEEDEDEDNKHETMWFYLVVMSGFATGFWGIVGSLFLKRSWRHALFRRVEDAYDWLYVAIVVRMARVKKKWEGSSD